MRVFVVQHQHELDGCDEVKFIGVYANEERAWAAVARAKALSGFRYYPDGFSVTHTKWTWITGPRVLSPFHSTGGLDLDSV